MPSWLPYAVTWCVSTLAGAGIAYAAFRAMLARQHENHEGRIRTLESEVGTRDSGLRRVVHDHAEVIREHGVKIDRLERK